MNTKKILMSFVGTNDAGMLKGNNDGAILTTLKEEYFDEVILLYNEAEISDLRYSDIVKHLESRIMKDSLAGKVRTFEFKLSDVTDHNAIYKSLVAFTDILDKSLNIKYTAAISSGTPSMQVCWILLAESGDFSESNPLRLIRTREPKFGKPIIHEVKLDTSLPKIMRLKNEVEQLKKDFIPDATISIKRPGLRIGQIEINLSPMELSYYKYFVERVKEGKGDEKFSGLTTTNTFLKRVIEIHQELFPDLDTNRMDLISFGKKETGLSITTFRGNVSKLNKKIRDTLNNETISKVFEISIDGGRGAKFYGIKALSNKLKIAE